MIRRRWRLGLMRLCAILLLMQSVVAAYACPELPQLSGKTIAAAAAMPSGVDADCTVDTMPAASVSSLCHEHYASAGSMDQSALPAIVPPPLASSFTVAATPPPQLFSPPVLPALLARATQPRIIIRFQVFRI